MAIDRNLSWPATRKTPRLPGNVGVVHQDRGNLVRWRQVEGEILGYRVYRAPQMGGPWTLLNSPYAESPGQEFRQTSILDGEGKPGDMYFVTAVDKNRRESHWFPNEPQRESRK